MKNIVVGAGISGLAAFKKLKDANADVKCFDAAPVVGGLTKSMFSDKYTFDHTGHLLHLAKHNSPNDLVGIINNDDWQRVTRNSGIFIDECIVPAPFQYNIGFLKKELKEFCYETYLSRSQNDDHSDLQSYFYNNFGQGIAEKFLIPYNEKLYAKNLNEFSLDAVSRFFPPPNDELIVAGYKKKNKSALGYNSQFWYPKKGGIQKLVDALAKDLQINTNSTLEQIELSQKQVNINGKKYNYDRLYSSVPLKDFVSYISDNHKINELGKKLSISATKVFNIGVASIPNDKFKDMHWVYFPEMKFKFHRVGLYHNFSSFCAPKGCSSIYVEIGYDQDLTIDLYKDILEPLNNLGILKKEKIECISEFSMKNSYVRFLKDTNSTKELIFKELLERDIFSIGRYGRWDYNSMEDSILDGRNIKLA